MGINYFDGQRGYPGTLVTGTDSTGTPKRFVVPAVTLTDGAGAAAPAGSAADPYSTSLTTSGSASNGLNRVFTPTVAGSLVVKASAGNLYGYNIVSGASAGYVMFFDSATVPVDGTVTPKMCFVLAANSSIQADRDVPLRFTTGIVMVFSTTGPFTKTISATAYLAGDAV